MKKKILVVCKSFYPTNGPRANRATELVKEFARLGHDVEVLTPKISVHESFEKENQVNIVDMGTTFLHGANRSIFKRAIMKTLLVLGIAERYNIPDYFLKNKIPALLKGKHYDLIVSVAKPHSIHWGVAKARLSEPKLCKIWVADCGDPFMGNPFHKYDDSLEKYERLFCKVADYITVPIKDAIPSYFPDFHDKIKVIPQGFNFENDRQFLAKYSENVIPTFAYAGAFYKDKRDPRTLLEYLVNLEIDFRFIIYTKNTDLVTPFLNKSQGKIVIKDYVPRHQLLYELSKMDFLININNISSVQSPSKLIDYFLTERPVLSINNNQVSSALNDFLNYDFREKYVFPNMSSYDIRHVANSFLAL